MAAKKSSKNAQPTVLAKKKRAVPAIPESLNTAEFAAAWAEWQRFTAERGIELTAEDATRQLQLLAKLGPDKAIADIRKTMENHPLGDRVPDRAKADKTKGISAKAQADQIKANKAKPEKAKPGKKAPAKKKMSALDAAAKVLAEMGGQSLNCQELVQAMADKGYWTSPGGRTPQATLYAAMLREIGNKGAEARFRKAERGKFALAVSK